MTEAETVRFMLIWTMTMAMVPEIYWSIAWLDWYTNRNIDIDEELYGRK